MADVYQQFLRAPSATLLAPDASLHYITTTSSIHEAPAIIKHLEAHSKQVEKRNEDVLSSIESSNGICVETATTYRFVKGGGMILPQMDDNMLADMEAVCAMVSLKSHAYTYRQRLADSAASRFMSSNWTPMAKSARSACTGTRVPC